MRNWVIAAGVGLSALAAVGPGPTARAASDDIDAGTTALTKIVDHARRDEDRVRDEFRHPAETLAFFGFSPDMTVIEWGPGGGWYTRILAPALIENGRYIGANWSGEAYFAGNPDRIARRNQWPEQFKSAVETQILEGAGDVDAVLGLAAETQFEPGAADMVLAFRGLHGLAQRDKLDAAIAEAFAALKPGGVFGVVQHRAPESTTLATDGTRGYLKQSDVIARFEAAGFELAGTSEINANPKDPASWARGVWTLPPTLAFGDPDGAFSALGESDRMTLKFVKPSA
ncbi:MAG: class I SAM-dependent methyltransferase [Maricaulaceae bacterium]